MSYEFVATLAKRVKEGVRFLDKKIPNWREVMRKHEDDYDFADGSCCVLGTLEHYSGRMKVLKARKKLAPRTNYDQPYECFRRAQKALDLKGRKFFNLGFDAGDPDDGDVLAGTRSEELDLLGNLWRAEFSK